MSFLFFDIFLVVVNHALSSQRLAVCHSKENNILVRLKVIWQSRLWLHLEWYVDNLRKPFLVAIKMNAGIQFQFPLRNARFLCRIYEVVL